MCEALLLAKVAGEMAEITLCNICNIWMDFWGVKVVLCFLSSPQKLSEKGNSVVSKCFALAESCNSM